MTKIPPLTRDEVRSVIQGRSMARRVPVFIHCWVHPESFGDRRPLVQATLKRYPADVQIVPFVMPRKFAEGEARDYCWLPYEDPHQGRQVAYDTAAPMADWRRLDEILSRFPRSSHAGLFGHAPAGDGRYRLAHWWFCLFERHWELRGMENALTDYYEHPQEVHRLFRALTDFYSGLIERAAREQHCDGIWTSDDLGTQTGPFFSPAIFREFFKPYYARLIDCAHSHGLEFWLHACGNVEPFIPDWIDAGLDVLHPIQKHTMDEKKIAALFGDKLTIFAGLDVQQVIPWGTPDEVRAEVRHLMDTFWRPGTGRCMLTAGNGINGDCPLESLEAFFEEALAYGTSVVLAAKKSPAACKDA